MYNVFASDSDPAIYEYYNDYNDPGRAVVFSATPVPEPTTVVLLSAGVVGVGIVRRRRA